MPCNFGQLVHGENFGQTRGCRKSGKLNPMAFLDHVERVAGNLDHQVGGVDDGLTGEARLRFQTPCLVEQVIFFLGAGIQGGESFAHDDVASGAGAGLFASMVKFDSGGE